MLIGPQLKGRTNYFVILSTIISDFIPLLGVLYLGWNISMILVICWFENLFAGIFNFLKILKAQDKPTEKDFQAPSTIVNHVAATPSMPAPVLAGFFAKNYGIFVIVHGIFLFAFIGLAKILPALNFSWWLILPIIGVILNQLITYQTDFIGKKKFETVSAYFQMSEPYRQVIILQIVIVGFALLFNVFKSPLLAAVLLVFAKTAADLFVALRK